MGGWLDLVFSHAGPCGVCCPELLPHSRGLVQACWFYLLTLNTLPLILLWVCFCVCGPGALEVDTLHFTNTHTHTERDCSTWVLLMKVYFPNSAV